jgi:hypothetical protein
LVLGLGLYLKILVRFCILFFLTSCSSDSPQAPAVPTTADEINKAQQAALSLADPTRIQIGEFVYFLKTQEVYTGQQEPSVNLMEEEGLTVVNRVDYPGYLELTLEKEVIDHLTAGSPHSLFKDVFYVATEPQPPSEDPVETAPANPNVKFYNLVQNDEKLRKPQKVIDKEPCVLEQDCFLNVKKISYDVVFLDPENPQTTKVEAWFSPEVPYFATVLKSCYTTVVSVDTARPLVRQCKSVFDYQFK